MSHRQSARVDRLTQMTKQEELIARKRQEILNKQRTAQLAKAVAAAQTQAAELKAKEDCEEQEHVEEHEEKTSDSNTEETKNDESGADGATIKKNQFSTKTGKISYCPKRTHSQPVAAEEPPNKAVNTFCNDGSFLENFKKILEKSEQPKPLLVPETFAKLTGQIVEDTPAVGGTELTEKNNVEQEDKEQHQNVENEEAKETDKNIEEKLYDFNVALVNQQHQQQQQQQFQAKIQQIITSQEQVLIPHLGMTLTQPPPPPPPATSMEAAVHASFFTSTAGTIVPPPPPPPQMPITLAQFLPTSSLYMIPPPEPLQLNAIKEFNLNALSQHNINLAVMQIPEQQHRQQQQQQLQQEQPQSQPLLQENINDIQQQETEVFSDKNDSEQNTLNDLPTSVEMLITAVAVNGDEYEDNLCHINKKNLHPTMWFIFDKNCEQYHGYRKQVTELRFQKQQQLTPAPLQPSNDLETTNKQESQPNTKRRIVTCNSDKYDPETAINGDIDSDDEYMRGMMDRNRDNIKRRIECRNELSEEERLETAAQEAEEQQRRAERKRLRKSRWGEKVHNELPSGSSVTATVQTSFGNQNKPVLKSITRTDPALLNYARNNYGTIDLSEVEWKKCEEHFKVNLLYQDMMAKRQEIDRLARSGKFKFEYDSDEDVEGGTWEHKLRCAEMEATHAWANALTKQSEGKHHIGDFLPPEELKKFMEQYEAKKSDRQPDLSDYKEYKLKEDNIGFQMLQKLGWKEGQGLGQDGAGIVEPVNKGPQREGNQGLGVGNAASPENHDNEYDAYRKRMMLAYRFRPNPLNNPRRAYY